jgi:hypothetical protein
MPIDLGDEHHREGAVHHRAVEVEGIAERQHERDDAVGDAVPLKLFQQARIGGLGTCRSKGEQARRANIPDKLEDAWPKDQESPPR